MKQLAAIFAWYSNRLSVFTLLAILSCAHSFGVHAADVSYSDERSSQVDKLFSPFTEGIQPGAAVMVIHDGAIVHSRGYGYADLEKKIPITPASAFRLASVSKQFTAMAIAILADNDRLDYSDPVGKYVAALSSYQGITIRHLLTHTSGLPDYYDEFDASAWVEKGTLPSNADVMAYEGMINKPLFAPGDQYEYSNPAYEALPLIVEAVSGQEFAVFMRNSVFEPIGMSASLIHDHHRPQIDQRVLGYSRTPDGYELNDDSPLNGIVGSGGQYSSLEDFYHWDQALYGDTLVSADTLKQVFTRASLNNGKEIDYGFGWRLDSYRGHDRIAHSGSWVGFRTAISRYPELGLTVVVLSNLAEYDPSAASDKVVDIYLEQPGQAQQADLVLQHGAIYTLDPDHPWQEAAAILDGRIVYVGSNQGVAAFTGPNTQVVDLKGRMVLPGLQDVHIHPISGGIEAASCDLNGMTTAEQYLARIKAYAEANPDLPWITGGGWLMSAFGPGAMPDKKLIDGIVPDRPVMLYSSDGHSSWVNSKALEVAGITRNTPDPEDGRIDRDPDTGELIGSLQEGASALLDQVIPAVTGQQRRDGLRYSVEMLNAYGITGVQDANVSEQDLQAYQALDARGELTLRVEASQWWDRDQGVEQLAGMVVRRKQYGNGHVRANTVKIMQDGVMENYTAVMLEPYLLDGDVRGIPMLEPDALETAVTAADAAGFQVHFHAIGDGAIRQSLDAVEAAYKANGRHDNRHHISHIQLIDPEDIPRFAELDVIANFQPFWAYADDYITELTIPFIGEQRARWLYPVKSVLDSGGMIAFGSDWSVSTANPFEEIEVAVTRMDPVNEQDSAFIPEERIGLEAAIAAFTINAAFTNHLEEQTGSIETGKLADLVILNQNLFEIPHAAISDTKVLVTLFEGKTVHGNLSEL